MTISKQDSVYLHRLKMLLVSSVALQCFWDCQPRTAGSVTNRSVICKEFLSSEYCTRSMCFCALGRTVQMVPLCYTNSDNCITALERLSKYDWVQVSSREGKGKEAYGVIVGWEQCSPCLEVSVGGII